MEGKITKQPARLLRSSVRPHTVAHFQVTDGRLALELLQALLFSSTYADERTALSFLYDPKPVSQAKGLQFLKGFERIKTQPVLFRLNLWVKPKPKPAVVHLLLIMNSDIFPLVFLLKEAFVLDIRSSAIRRNISYTRGSPPPRHIYLTREYKGGKGFKTVPKAELKPHDSFPWVRRNQKQTKQAWWHTHLIPALWRQKQMHLCLNPAWSTWEFQARHHYIPRLCVPQKFLNCFKNWNNPPQNRKKNPQNKRNKPPWQKEVCSEQHDVALPLPRDDLKKESLPLLTFSLLERGASAGLQGVFEQGGHLVSSIIMKVS